MKRQKNVRVRDHMSRRVVLLEPDMEIVQAAHLLIRNDISAAPVVDQSGALVGILTERDFMRVTLQAGYYHTPGDLVKDVMTPNPAVVGADASIFDLARRFAEGPYRRYPVVEDGRVVGMISRRDVMRALGQFYPD